MVKKWVYPRDDRSTWPAEVAREERPTVRWWLASTVCAALAFGAARRWPSSGFPALFVVIYVFFDKLLASVLPREMILPRVLLTFAATALVWHFAVVSLLPMVR